MGRVIRACIGIGLIGFLLLAVLPGASLYALYVVLLTPLLVSIITGIELLLTRQVWQGISLLGAVLLICIVVLMSLP